MEMVTTVRRALGRETPAERLERERRAELRLVEREARRERAMAAALERAVESLGRAEESVGRAVATVGSYYRDALSAEAAAAGDPELSALVEECLRDDAGFPSAVLMARLETVTPGACERVQAQARELQERAFARDWRDLLVSSLKFWKA